MLVSNRTRNELKRCGRCKILKLLSEFGLVHGKPRSSCKICKRAEYHKVDKRAEKKCSRCKVVKMIEEFPNSKTQRRHYCKLCQPIVNRAGRNRRRLSGEDQAYWRKYYDERRRWTQLKSRYGITKEQYLQTAADQGNLCAICMKPETETSSPHIDEMDLSVDHCHATGQVRGLLCRQCNIALGRFKEDVSILKSAIAYLEKYAQRKENQ